MCDVCGSERWVVVDWLRRSVHYLYRQRGVFIKYVGLIEELVGQGVRIQDVVVGFYLVNFCVAALSQLL